MKMPPNVRAAQIENSRQSAAAFVEDIHYVRELLRTAPSRGEVRRLSASMRRILVDNGGDLRVIAPPRIGRVMLAAPDSKSLVNASGDGGYKLYSSGPLKLAGNDWNTCAFGRSEPGGHTEGFMSLPIITLNQDGFLNQKVICAGGVWIRRYDVIVHIANIGSGVHSNEPKELKDRVLAGLSNTAWYEHDRNGKPALGIKADLFLGGDIREEYDDRRIDVVLFQLLSAAYLVSISDDVLRLEEAIQEELLTLRPRDA